jgi:hypothetical protein
MDLPFCGWLRPLGNSLWALQRHFPTGPAWDAWRIEGKNGWLLLRAISNAFEDAWTAMCRLAGELDPRTTTDLLPEWEAAVGLPDPCLPNATTLDERRQWVLWRLAKKRWSKASDWHALASLFGLQIRMTPGWRVQRPSLYRVSYPSLYTMPKLGRFRIYIEFVDCCDVGGGYPYSYAFGYSGFSQRCKDFMCLIERVCPACVVIVWGAPPIAGLETI